MTKDTLSQMADLVRSIADTNVFLLSVINDLEDTPDLNQHIREARIDAYNARLLEEQLRP